MPRQTSPSSAYLLRVQLEEIRPAIWREILVPCDTTLDCLHRAIQAAFPWANSHLHEFRLGQRHIAVPDPDYDFEVEDERKVRVEQILPRVGATLLYEYDSGDCWGHEIRVRKILPIGPQEEPPRVSCLGGERACPPDDCGGVSGYEELLLALAHPNHTRHEELTEWLTSYRSELARYDPRFKGPFDPEAFDPDVANKAVGKAMLRRRK